MVSDGLSMINMQMSATSFQLAESKIGDNNYLGNDIFYPPNGKTGANVLLGTKTMIPIDGPVRENVGLLGSPPFEIPRMVDRDRDMIASFDEKTRRARLRQKNAYNFVTALLFLASRWMAVFAAARPPGAGRYRELRSLRCPRVLRRHRGARRRLSGFLHRAWSAGAWASSGSQPKLVSIYDPYFWSIERHWKLKTLSDNSPIWALFAGTPFRHHTSRHGHEGRRQGVRLQRVDQRAYAHRGRRPRQSERGLRPASTLARGRRVQVRLHLLGQRLLGRPGRHRSLWRQHGRSRRARPRFVPDEG